MATKAIPSTVGTDWRRRFHGLSWTLVVFTVGVIVSGDIVQATESGAGCGESWPRCDGSLIPVIGDANTAVEFTHRIATSVLSLGFVALVIGAWKLYGTRHRVWKATVWATVFLVIEILVGAALVLFGWVEDDASWGRVFADGLHVVNTFLLLGATVVVAWFAGGGSGFQVDRTRGVDRRLLASAGVVLLIAITGTLNSLADTLALSDTVDIDETPIAAILVSVRGIHPALAIAGGIGVFALMVQLSDDASDGAVRFVLAIQAVIAVQFVVGILNIALLTPLETQIVHLVLADVIWILVMLLVARMLSARGASSEVAA
jgi:heme A synthase